MWSLVLPLTSTAKPLITLRNWKEKQLEIISNIASSKVLFFSIARHYFIPIPFHP